MWKKHRIDKYGRHVYKHINKAYYKVNCMCCKNSFETYTNNTRFCSSKCKENYNILDKIKLKEQIDSLRETVFDEIIKLINDKNRFPRKSELIFLNNLVNNRFNPIKEYFKSIKYLPDGLRERYEKGEFAIIEKCKNCNSEMDITYSQGLSFCSNECRSAYILKNSIEVIDRNTGKIIRRYKDNIHVRKCVLCERLFYDKNEGDFCSDECKNVVWYKRNIEEEIFKNGHVEVKCDRCDSVFLATKYQKHCDSCLDIIKENNANRDMTETSTIYKSQEILHNIIKELISFFDIEYNKRYGFLNGLQLDIYIPYLNLAFEYDGKQHYEYIPYFHKSLDVFKMSKIRDKNKNKLCKINNITLIRIRYDDYLNWKTVLYKLREFDRRDVIELILDNCTNQEITDFIEFNFNLNY